MHAALDLKLLYTPDIVERRSKPAAYTTINFRLRTMLGTKYANGHPCGSDKLLCV